MGGFRDWGWWKLFTCVKPLLKNKEEEEAAKKKEAEMLEKMAQMEKDAGMLKDAEEKVVKLTKENAELARKLELEETSGGETAAKLEKDRQALDLKCKGLTADLEARDGSIASLQNEKKRLEQNNAAQLDELQA